VLRRKCRSRKRGPEAENRQGGAPRGARPDRKGRRAPRRVPGLQRHKRVHARLGRTLQANRVPQHPGACRRSAHPSIGVATEEANSEYDVGRKEKGKKKKENGEEKMGRSDIRRVGKGARRTIDGLATRSIACAVPTRQRRGTQTRGHGAAQSSLRRLRKLVCARAHSPVEDGAYTPLIAHNTSAIGKSDRRIDKRFLTLARRSALIGPGGPAGRDAAHPNPMQIGDFRRWREVTTWL
jgi:hypothetical protein